MFSIREISAAPHFPHTLLPLIAATVEPQTPVSLHVCREQSAADVEITERDGKICIAINVGLTGNDVEDQQAAPTLVRSV
jgi:hypothetical protein